MTRTISRYLSHQHAPAILFRFPLLLYFYFWLNRISVLRMKYAHRAIGRVVKTMDRPLRVTDAGCGMGDFIFSVPEISSSEKTVGIDFSPSNIGLCFRLKELL